MPCNCDGYITTDYHELANQFIAMLCSVCEKIEKCGQENKYLTPEIQAWWLVHKKIDATKKAIEKKEKEIEDKKVLAKKKLTPEERKLLGLRD